MTVPAKKSSVLRLKSRVGIRAAKKTTQVSLGERVQDHESESLPTVPSVVRRRNRAGIRSVSKTTELPLD